MPDPSKNDVVEFVGVIEELLPAGMFRVRLENEHMILAYLSGKMRKNHIRLTTGDSVRVEMSPYDLTKGRIVYRQ
ncbi:MAG: translation initiation factor IF-1 [Patescibacteria group bacterium]